VETLSHNVKEEISVWLKSASDFAAHQTLSFNLSRFHMPTFTMKKAATHPAGNSLQDAANSLLGLINSLFGAN
jgi:hypothetical protein